MIQAKVKYKQQFSERCVNALSLCRVFALMSLSVHVCISLCWTLLWESTSLGWTRVHQTKPILLLPQQSQFPSIVFKHQTVLTEFKVNWSLSSIEPVSIEPCAIEPVSIEPVSIEPCAIEPVSIEPRSTERVTSLPWLSPSDEVDWLGLDREAYWLSVELCGYCCCCCEWRWVPNCVGWHGNGSSSKTSSLSVSSSSWIRCSRLR